MCIRDRLLALSRMDAGRVPVEMQEVDASRLIQEVARELEPVAEDAGCLLYTSLENT